MAWFQNLAGKAEDLLNKIDQNAGTVLQESTTKLLDISSNIIEPFDYEKHNEDVAPQSFNENTNNDVLDSVQDFAIEEAKQSANQVYSILQSNNNLDDDIEIKNNRFESAPVKIFEKEIKSESCGLSSKSDSFSNNFNVIDELQVKLEERIVRLEAENQEINHQMLNVLHLYSEAKNENVSLKAQLDRANETVLHAQNEMEQYKARAQRILQEKENLLSFKREGFTDLNQKLTAMSTFIEELKRELEYHQEKNKELSDRNHNLNSELNQLQQEIVTIHNLHHKEKQNLQNALALERKHRLLSEEECRSKIKELNAIKNDMLQLEKLCSDRNKENEELKFQIKNRSSFQLDVDMDSRMQSLTDKLMGKQSALETITSERNALRIQLEKLERDYNQLLQCQRNKSAFSNINDLEEGRLQIPKLTVVSPLDVGVKRKVKHTFSAMDAISIRTGVFLRRYPLARIFVFYYMMLLHIWVLYILFMEL